MLLTESGWKVGVRPWGGRASPRMLQSTARIADFRIARLKLWQLKTQEERLELKLDPRIFWKSAMFTINIIGAKSFGAWGTITKELRRDQQRDANKYRGSQDSERWGWNRQLWSEAACWGPGSDGKQTAMWRHVCNCSNIMVLVTRTSVS